MNKTTNATHLLEFSVENYRSIRELVTLSLVSSRASNKTHSFTIPTNDKRVLNGAVLYGANASGKSNLLRALFIYRNAITGTVKLFNGESIDPFLLDELSKTKDTVFEAVFEHSDVMYIYGFKVSARSKTVSGEWLRATRPNSSRLRTIFERDGDNVDINKNLQLREHGISRVFTRLVQPRELFLTTVSKNSEWSIAKDVVRAWENCQVLNTLVHDKGLKDFVADSILNTPHVKDMLLPLLQQADLGITDIRVTKDVSGEYDIKLQHAYENKNSERSVWFDIEEESVGTVRFFSFALPLLLSLQEGTLMVLDELGSTLHPDLLKYMVSLFNDSKSNKNNAQLILTTHDTTLLKGMLTSEQVYFTRKTAQQNTELYSLSDIKGIRKDLKSMDDRYLRGDLGAVPEIIWE